MRRVFVGALLMSWALAGCHSNDVIVGVDAPAAPQNVDASYYGGVVTVTWELASNWNGETFRIYSKRVSDANYFLIAEVSSCAQGLCSYEDRNVVAGETYDYYVSAVDPDTGVETASANTIEVTVPQPVPPPVPTGLEVIGLDNTIYLRWSANATTAGDFSFYRVYLDAADGTQYLLGDTDSEGFLDALAVNGETYSYYVTSVDTQGNESAGSVEVSGTPRPDYHGEVLYAYSDQPTLSGFRFQADEMTIPVVDGASTNRQFRLEVDANGWWLVPNAQQGSVYPTAYPTSALRCGPGADADCLDVSTAPTSGYTSQAVSLASQNSYVLRVTGDDGLVHYGVIRVETLGYDQNGDALMIFDWAYQLQAGNPSLSPVGQVTFATR